MKKRDTCRENGGNCIGCDYYRSAYYPHAYCALLGSGTGRARTGEERQEDHGKIKEEKMDIKIKKYLSEIGKKGGSRSTEAKRRAARENGKKGGRPKSDTKEKIF